MIEFIGWKTFLDDFVKTMGLIGIVGAACGAVLLLASLA